MSNEAQPSNGFSEEERAALSEELRDPATSFDRLGEIADLVNERVPQTAADQIARMPAPALSDMSDEELSALLTDSKVSSEEKDAIAGYIIGRKAVASPEEDTPGAPE